MPVLPLLKPIAIIFIDLTCSSVLTVCSLVSLKCFVFCGSVNHILLLNTRHSDAINV